MHLMENYTCQVVIFDFFICSFYGLIIKTAMTVRVLNQLTRGIFLSYVYAFIFLCIKTNCLSGIYTDIFGGQLSL